MLGLVEKITSKNTRNPLANLGIDIGVNLFLQKILLRNAGWVTKLLMPVFVKNFLSHEAVEKENIFSKIGSFLKNKLNGHVKT